MEFSFDFDWKDYSPSTYRVDNAEMSHTSRVGFTGVIGSETQKPAELHSDVEKTERQDFGEIKFAQDTNGRIRGRAVITTIGVYPYIKEDGSVQWELRHPDDVYDPDSLRTLELLPLTNNHPSEKVTKDNVQDLQVGHLGEFVMVDTMHGFVTNTVVIGEAVAVADVMGGKRALSAGYSCDVVPESGTWNGVPYTARQKNIRYNHVSIVDRGRAGDDAVMKFDSFDGFQTKINKDSSVDHTDVNTDEEVTMGDKNLKTIKLDGVEYEAEAAVITAFTKTNEKLDSMKDLPEQIEKLRADVAKLEGERDSAVEKSDKLEKELEKSIKVDQLEDLFQKRQKLDEAGSLAKIEDFDKLDVASKMEAVVVKVSPETEAILEAKKDSDTYMVYLESRFDSAVESLKKDSETLIENLRKSTGAGSTSKNDADEGNEEIKTDEDFWNTLVHASEKKVG